MKKLLFILLILVQSLTVFAANIGDDTVNIGQKGSTGDKALIFRDANQTSLGVEHATSFLSWGGDQFTIGDGTNSDKKYVFDVGLGANNPFFLWNSTKNKLGFSNDGTALKDIGSGSGGGGGENFNNAFTADQNANAEDGTTGWTASAGTFTATSTDPLEGDQSFEWTPAAQNDTLDSPVLDVDRDIFKGKSCEARITYIGGDENLTLKVLNGDDEELGSEELMAAAISGQQSVFFACPSDAEIVADSDKGDLRIRIENTGASASALIKWDQSYLGTLRGLTEVSLPDTFAVSVDIDGTVLTESTDWINGNCSKSGTGIYNCPYNNLGITEPMSCIGITNRGNVNRRFDIVTSSLTQFQARTFAPSGSTDGLLDEKFSVHCQKTGSDAKQTVQVYKSIPERANNENFLVARVNAAGGIARSNVNWVESATNDSTGRYTLTVLTGVIRASPTAFPMCTVTAETGSAAITGYDMASFAASREIEFEIYDINGNLSNRSFTVHCARSLDYKVPTVQPVIVGQHTDSVLSPGTGDNGKGRLCSWRGSTGSTSASSEVGDCLASITDIGGNGSKRANFNASYWADTPTCVCSGTGNTPGARVCSTNPSSTSVEIHTSNPSSGSNIGMVIVCHGKAP